MILFAIIAAEIAFWVVIFLGLVARYLLQLRVLGAILLACSPIIDLALLVFIVIDLRAGSEPHWTHGLGAIYLGFSVIYGRRLVRWADQRFAALHGVARLKKTRLYGKDKVRHEWRETVLWWLACGISTAILALCILLAGGVASARELLDWIWRLALVAGAAPIVPVTYMLWPAKPPQEATAAANHGQPD